MSVGRSLSAALSAACTSRAAPSMLRLRSNWMVIWVWPSVDCDVIDEMPEIVPIILPSDRPPQGFGEVDRLLPELRRLRAAAEQGEGGRMLGVGAYANVVTAEY